MKTLQVFGEMPEWEMSLKSMIEGRNWLREKSLISVGKLLFQTGGSLIRTWRLDPDCSP